MKYAYIIYIASLISWLITTKVFLHFDLISIAPIVYLVAIALFVVCRLHFKYFNNQLKLKRKEDQLILSAGPDNYE